MARVATATLSVALSPMEKGLLPGSKRRRSKPRPRSAPAGRAGELEVGQARVVLLLPGQGCLLAAARLRDGGAALTYTSTSSVARAFAVAGGPAASTAGRLYSRRICPPGAFHDPRPARSRPPAVRGDAGRLPAGGGRRRAGLGRRCQGDADGGRGPARGLRRRRRTARLLLRRAVDPADVRQPGALHGDGARQLSGRLPPERRSSSSSPSGWRASWCRACISPMPAARSGSPSTSSSASPTQSWRISGCSVQPAAGKLT